MKCPRCDGYGEIDLYPGGGFELNPGNRPSSTTRCPICRGTGETTNPPKILVDTPKKQSKP